MKQNSRRAFIKRALVTTGGALILGNSETILAVKPKQKKSQGAIPLPSRKENPNISRGVQLGNFKPEPSNTGKNWKVTGETVYNILADSHAPALLLFGLDTEGGDRAKTNLLRKPIELEIELADNSVVYSSEFGVRCKN